MGLQHVGQANANQPYNSGEQTEKVYNNWMKIPHSHSQPSLSLCLSLQLGISSSWCPPCLPCRKIVLSEFSVTTQTNLEAAGGQCSAVRLPGCYQGVPDTSTAPDLGLGAAILCLRLTLRQKAETQHQCFHQVSSTKYYFSHYYTVVGGGESQDFLTF